METLSKKSVKRNISYILAIGIVSSSLVGFMGIGSGSTASTENAVLYKEEVVTRGNIVVGLNEAGAINMNSTDASFAFDGTITETFVKAGQSVTTGTLLARGEPSEDDTTTADYQSQLSSLQSSLTSAKISLDSTLISAQTKTISAEKTYLETIYNGANADLIYENTITSLLESYVDVHDTLDDLYYDKYSINNKLSNLSVSYYIDGLTEAKAEALEVYEVAEEALNLLKSFDFEETPFAQTDYAIYGSYETALQTLTNTYDDAKEDYDDASDALSTGYTNYYNAKDVLESELATVTSKINSANDNLYDTESKYELGLIDADTDYQILQYNFQMAELEKSNTLLSIENDVATAQDKVTSIQQEISELYAEMAEVTAYSTEIYAPCDGWIMTASAVGDSCRADVGVFSIAKVDSVNLYVSIPQDDISQISIDMPATVVLDAYSDYVMPAYVDAISITPASGMQSTVNYTVTIACDISSYSDLVILQGMTASITFIQRSAEDVLVVSSKCIENINGQQYVKLKNADGTLTQTLVQTGFSDGFDVEITSGVKVGDIVVIESAVMG